MDTPVCIVTGANSGIGKEVSIGLVKAGCHVVMACRNLAACQHAKEDIDARGHPGVCECSQLDLNDFTSIRQFAARTHTQLNSTRRKVKVLVNNAGVMGVSSAPSGEDLHMRINHLGPFLLTRLMTPSMQPGSRIVNIASRAHYLGSLTVEDRQLKKTPKHWLFQYARSKLCNVLFTQELRQRFEGQGICSYSVSPGLVGTSLFNSLSEPMRSVCNWAAPYIMRTPEKGAETVLYAALSEEVEGRSVLFLHDKKYMKPSAQALDPHLSRQLWEASSIAVGLPQE